MAATSKANHLRKTLLGYPALLDLTKVFKQGQFQKRATVGGVVKIQPAILDTDGPTVVGVAEFTVPAESLPEGTEAPQPLAGTLQHTGVFGFKGRVGEIFLPWLFVVIDEVEADGQSVRLKGGGDAFTNVVGIVEPQVAAAGILGTGAPNIPIWIAPPALGRNDTVGILTLL